MSAQDILDKIFKKGAVTWILIIATLFAGGGWAGFWVANIVQEKNNIKTEVSDLKIIVKTGFDTLAKESIASKIAIKALTDTINKIKVVVSNTRNVTEELILNSQQTNIEIRTQLKKLYESRSLYGVGYVTSTTIYPFSGFFDSTYYTKPQLILTSNGNPSSYYRSN